MRDYSLTPEERKEYILTYKIVDDELIVQYANGECKCIPYTEEDEQEILSRKNQQVRRAKVKPLGFFDNVLTILEPVALPAAITNFINDKDFSHAMMLGLVAGGTIYYPYQRIMYNLKTRELDKLRYFQFYEEELREISNLGQNELANFKKKTAKKIQEETQGNRPLNINSADNFSLKELQVMREYIEKRRPEEGPARGLHLTR